MRMPSQLFWIRFWRYGAIAFAILMVAGLAFGTTSPDSFEVGESAAQFGSDQWRSAKPGQGAQTGVCRHPNNEKPATKTPGAPAGIKPAFDMVKIKATFYLRAAIAE
jgi:hypothetical protein